MGFHFGPDYLALPRIEQPWIVQDVLPVGGMTNIYGDPKVGKSMLVLQMAAAIADPATDFFMGFPIVRHSQVAYLQIDTPRSTWVSRVENMALSHGLRFDEVAFADLEDVPYPFYVNAPDGTPGQGFDWLKEMFGGGSSTEGKPFHPDVLILDTTREIHDGDENDSAHMQKIVALIRAVASSMAIILISHARKNDPMRGKSLMDDNRGSGYVAGRMDCVMRVTEKALVLKGRTVPETVVSYERDPEDGFLTLADPVVSLIREQLIKYPERPLREVARVAQERFPGKKSPEAMYQQVRRMHSKLNPATNSKRPLAPLLDSTMQAPVARDLHLVTA